MATGTIVTTSKIYRYNMSGVSSEADKPWEVIKRLFSVMPTGSLVGTIDCAGTRHYMGYKMNDNYGAFIVDLYSHQTPVYRVVMANGVCRYAPISTGDWTTVSNS